MKILTRSRKSKRTRLRYRLRPRFEPLEPRRVLATITWDGDTGTDWHTDENWVGDHVPTAIDDVVIGPSFANVTISSSSDVTVNSVDSEASLVIESGTFEIATDSNISRLTNNGTVDVLGGTLSIGSGPSGESHNGTFTGATLTHINFNGTHTLETASSVTTLGSVRLEDATVKGDYVTGETKIENGTTDFPGATQGKSLDISDKLVVVGTANFFDTNLSPKHATIQGSLISGNLTVDSLLWTHNGSMAGAGTTTVSTGGNLSADAGTLVLDNRTLNIETGATALWSSVAAISDIELANGAQIHNKGDFTFNHIGQASIHTSGGTAGTFQNDGSLTKVGDSVYINVAFQNDGTVDVEEGTLSIMSDADGVSHNGTFTGATLTHINFNGTHTLETASSVTTLGSVRLEDATVKGDYVTGETKIENGTTDFPGATQGKSLDISDKLVVVGTANFFDTNLSPKHATIQGSLISGNLTVDSLLWTHNGSMAGAGTTTVSTGGNLSADAGTLVLDNRTLNIETGATALWSSVAAISDIELANGAQIHNKGDFTFNHIGQASIHTSGGTAGTFQNDGSLTKVGDSVYINVAFQNDGTVDVEEGTLSIMSDADGVSHNGTFTGATLTHINFNGTHTLETASSVTTLGSVRLEDATVKGDYVTGETKIENGTTDFPGATQGKSLDISDKLVVVGTANFFDTNLSPKHATIQGSLISGNLTVDSLLWTHNGSMAGAGTTTVSTGGNLSADAGTLVLDNRTLNIETGATALWSSVAAISDIELANGAQIHNNGDFTFDHIGQASIYTSGVTAGSFQNDGSLIKVEDDSVDIEVAFQNDGTVDVQDGVLRVMSDYVQTSDDAQTILNGGSVGAFVELEAGLLSGSGPVNGAVFNSGFTNPGFSSGEVTISGEITISQSYEQAPDGILLIELGGLEDGSTPGTEREFDHLQASENVILDGDLDVDFINSFQPQVGDSFTIITNTALPIDGAGNPTTSGHFINKEEIGDEPGRFEVGNIHFEITYKGGDGNDVVITAVNTPPTADAGGPYSVPEGGTVQLDASASIDAEQSTSELTFEWDLDEDGVFGETGPDAHRGDEVGMNPIFNAAGLDGPAIPASHTIYLRVTDDGGLSDPDNAIVSVTNVDPVILSITNTSAGCGGIHEGEAVEVTVYYDDGGLPDTHSVTIDWGDGTTSQADVDQSGRVASDTHLYEDGGSYDLAVMLTDDDGGLDQSPTRIVVSGAGVVDSELHIVGTDARDVVTLNRQDDDTFTVIASFLGANKSFDATGINRILGSFCDGNDVVTVAAHITIPTKLDGGAGDDKLKGGNGHDIILGGDGDDLLVGKGGRDLLIGGAGADRIVGNSDDDILIAGYVSFTSVDVAIDAIMAEWTSERDYSTRVANIRGTGTGPRENGSIFLIVSGEDATVLDDGARDILTGSADQDWFFANLEGGVLDSITDLDDEEFEDELAWILS